MLTASILMILIGVFCIPIGNSIDSDYEHQMEYFFEHGTRDDSGEFLAGLGVILLIVGIVLLIIALIKDSGSSSPNSNNNNTSKNIQNNNEYTNHISKITSLSQNTNTWKCICGIVNADYVGTCSCGRTKQDVKNSIKTNYQKAKQDTPQFKICYSCGKNILYNAKFCNSCGASQKDKKCFNCGCSMTADSIFCMECGQKYVESQGVKTEEIIS